MSSPRAEVRAAAIEALGELRAEAGRESVVSLLQDRDVRVRRAAAGAAGKLAAREAIELLLKLMTEADSAVRGASLDSLRLLREPRAVPLAVAALSDRELALTALECLAELGGPDQAATVVEVAKQIPSADVLSAAVRVLTKWRDKYRLQDVQYQTLDEAVARVHGATGILARWQVAGEPVPVSIPRQLIGDYSTIGSTPFPDPRTVYALGPEGRVLAAPKSDPKYAHIAYTEVVLAESTPVEFLASSSGSLQIWLNGHLLHRRDQVQKFQIDSDRFSGIFAKGNNRLLVFVGPSGGTAEFHLRFRRKSAKAEHERLTQAALNRAGNPERGRGVFFDLEKSLCLKCHQFGEQGERIGPDLTGVGSRFSRIYIVESILEPSRTIAPSFGTLVILLKNGKTLTGVKVAETETTLTLADNQGQKHVSLKADIDERHPSSVSTMPEGLEKRFTENEFIDLVAFLASQRQQVTPNRR